MGQIRTFDAVITRDGSVFHVPWGTHLDIIRRHGIPENKSPVRQNYREYNLRAPFSGGYNGLQARGIETPPEPVGRAAERLTENLCRWHQGKRLANIPDDWGDVVEHVYELLGPKTPKFPNGRGGVYFSGGISEIPAGFVARLLGAARVRRLCGTTTIGGMWGSARVEEAAGDARICMMYEAASVGRMRERAVVEMMCQSSVVEEMRDGSRVLKMHGASRVLALYDTAAAGRSRRTRRLRCCST